LQHAVRGREAGQGRLPSLLAAENGDEDFRLVQVGRDTHAGDGDQSDPGILEVSDAVRDNASHRFVHSPHPLRHR
jgi:hypothetical protein